MTMVRREVAEIEDVKEKDKKSVNKNENLYWLY